jgi:tRNA dimethylallyltransferase
MERIDRRNRRRLVRAIEVSILAGVPFSSLRSDWSAPDTQPAQNHAIPGVALERDREELYARIDARARRMFAQGVIEELEEARGNAGPTAAQAIGYAEILALRRGEMDAETCIVTIQKRTRRYAKRQLTWLRSGNILSRINLTKRTQSEAVDFITRQIEGGGPGVNISGVLASQDV